jgi:acyl-CoA reductase-like NAD-dependent aldehyde dehydrogenase
VGLRAAIATIEKRLAAPDTIVITMTHITQELAASHTPIDVLSPADGSLVGSAANLTADEVAAAVAGLRAEQPLWEALGFRARREWMGRYRDWLLDHDNELVKLLQAETAKPMQEARLELALLLDLLNCYCKHVEAFADEHPRGHSVISKMKRLTITRRPYPVVGVISPWNFPLLIALVDSVPALLAGAAVAAKPSELTPLAKRRAIDLSATNKFGVDATGTPLSRHGRGFFFADFQVVKRNLRPCSPIYSASGTRPKPGPIG